MESFMKAMTDMNITFNNRMAELERLNKNTSTSASLYEVFATFKKFVLQALSNPLNQVQILACSVENMEMQSRWKMLLFHGVTEEKNEEPKLLITKIITEDLKNSFFTFSITYIQRGHRMGRAATSDLFLSNLNILLPETQHGFLKLS